MLPASFPSQHRASSMKMPNARSPDANFHTTGAWVAVERWLATSRRVTERFLRSPITAGAYPFFVFSPIFFCASARALSSDGNVLTCVCP